MVNDDNHANDMDDEEEEYDDDDDIVDARGRRRSRAAADGTGGLIPYKNPSALAAYYCGLFSLIPGCGFFLGLAGVILGIMGLRHRAQHPEVSGAVHAWIGIVLGGIGTIVWGFVLIVALIAIIAG